MYDLTPPARRRKSPLAFLAVVALFSLVALCAVTTLGLASWLQTTSARSPAPRVAVPLATPRPQVVVQPPPEGIDYESAVLRNIYEQYNRSVVNITVWMDHPPIEGTSLLPDLQDDDGRLMPLVNG